MKNITLTSTLILAGLLASTAHAATAVGNFNVNVTLTSQCQINSTNPATAATITDLALAYTSFQTAPSTGNTSFNIRCTNTLPFSLALDNASVTDGTTGLAYTLALSTTSVSIATAIPTLAGQSGTGANVQYFVQANIAGGQAGTATAGTSNKLRTLTVTY